MKAHRVVFPILLFLLGSVSPSGAQQQPKKPAAIKLEDPELYFAFLRAHSAVDQQIQTSTAAAGAQLSSSTASLYSINPAELPKLTAQVRTFMANLAAWSAQEQAYVAQQCAAKKLPDMKTLVNYQRQRQRLVMNAHGSIHGALTTASWTGLYGYVNGSFKTALQTAGAGK